MVYVLQPDITDERNGLMVTALYTACKKVYDQGRIEKTGWHSVKAGSQLPVYTSSIGGGEIMDLLHDPDDPRKNILCLSIPRRSTPVSVYADPAAHGRSMAVTGAREAEVLAYLQNCA